MTSSRYTIISADTHGGTKAPGYRDYLDPAYRGDYDSWLTNEYPAVERGYYQAAENAVKTWGGADGMDHGDAVELYLKAQEDGMGDAGQRIRALESDGVVAAVVYPNGTLLTTAPFAASAKVFELLGMTGGRKFSREHQWAGVRAYNRFLADFCSEYPDRLAGIIAVVDYEDLDRAIEVIEEGAEAGLRGGINLPALNIDKPGLHESYWDRLWSVCEHYDLPVNQHAGLHVDPRVYGNNSEGLNDLLVYATNLTFRPLPLAMLILGGVFDRHPSLRLVYTEQSADWIPAVVNNMQERVTEGFGMDVFRQKLEMHPRDYWERNCAVGATFMTPREARMRHEIGLSSIMWGSDFPHPESTYPYTRESLRLSFSDVPEDELRPILGGNAARIYGFDLECLQPIADRVGPSVDEIAAPLVKAPEGFRRFSFTPSEDRDLVPA